MIIDLPETDPDRDVIMWLAAVVQDDVECEEAKDRIDAGIILLGYISKWKKEPALRGIIKGIMKKIALDDTAPVTERLRAAAVSL